MKKELLFLGVVLMFSCCVSQSEHDKVVKEYNVVLEEKEQLDSMLKEVQKELDIYRSSPSKLCANIDQLFKERNIQKLKEIEFILSKYHPESKELLAVKKYCSIIENQIKKEKEVEEKKRLQAVNKLRKKYDDVSNTTWYYNPYFTHYTNSNKTSIYMGYRGEHQTWLRLEMSYTGDDWIFFENAYLSYDGNTKEINFNRYSEKESDNSGGEVWEWIDVSVDDSLLEFLRKLVKGKSVKMRLSGKYTKTRNLTTNEINGIKDVILAYDVLNEEIKNNKLRVLNQ